MSEAMDNVVYDDGFMWDDDPDAPVDLAHIVGKGYNTFWHDRHLYCMLKGSKGSKKSKTVALRWMYLLTEFPQASLLVIRRYGNTLADSCFSDLVWAMNKLHIREYWRVNKSSLRIRNPDTNQEIHFRGLDDSYKIASIAVEDSYLCWVWFEEFSEITNEEDFLRVTMSIRGQLPPGYFKQFVCSFNPWSENLWFKSKFFDTPREDTFTLTTTFRDNEFLDDVDRQRYLDLYEQNPRMARIICDGDWGIAEGLVYENWKVEEFNLVNILSKQGVVSVFGLDFGFKVSYNAFVAMSIDIPEKKIYVWDEMYERGQTNLQLVKKIAAMGYDREVIWADSAAPLIIHELQEGIPEEVTCDDGTKTVVRWALPNIRGAVKGHDSVMSGIARLQCFQFIVLPKCVNFVHELNNYCYDKDKDGKSTDKPIKDFDHCLVAGTLVLTDKGEVPIEDVQVGDMVMTHLGYRRVLASGITRSEPAEIWEMTCSDGTVLKGTSNHPIVTADGVKYLCDVTDGDVVIKWQKWVAQSENASTPNASNMMDCTGTDIQTLMIEHTGSISGTVVDQTGKCTSIDTSGRNTTEISQKDSRSITSTITPSTTTSQISLVSQSRPIIKNTPSQMSAEQRSETGCAEIPTVRTSAGSGTNPKKDVHGIPNMERQLPQPQSQKNLCASSVPRFSHPQNQVQNSAQTPANLLTEEPQVSITRAEFVRCVVDRSSQTNTARLAHVPIIVPQICAPITVCSVKRTPEFETVYDLTVEEAHEFFANGLLTLNCMDAMRYASSSILVSGKGRVCEIVGGSTPKPATGTKGKCRRVVSTI